MNGEPRNRISKSSGWLMIGTAIFLDVISLFPAVNWVSGVASIFVFPYWFLIHGVFFLKNRKMLKGGIISIIIEMVPFLSIIPALTFTVTRTVLSIQSEDRKAISAWQSANAAKIMNRTPHFNQTNSRRVDSIRRAP